MQMSEAQLSAHSGSLAARGFITAAAVWGRLTHQAAIQVARNLALSQSRDADQPAMLTIMFGVGLVLLTYILQIAIVGELVGSFWVCALYLVSLLSGAYWAAFEKHPQRR
jgi:general stress protein CsbA